MKKKQWQITLDDVRGNTRVIKCPCGVEHWVTVVEERGEEPMHAEEQPLVDCSGDGEGNGMVGMAGVFGPLSKAITATKPAKAVKPAKDHTQPTLTASGWKNAPCLIPGWETEWRGKSAMHVTHHSALVPASELI